MKRAKRSRLLSVYRRRPAGAKLVTRLVDRAVTRGRGLSFVRAGDMVTLILVRRHDKILPRVYPFLGIPNPPPKEIRRELHRAVATATILGVNEMTGADRGATTLNRYLRRHKIRPPYITQAFMNDELYRKGHVMYWIKRHRPVLVGRAAPDAARRLGMGLTGLPLQDWTDLRSVFSTIMNHHADRRLILIGASVPGRILCGWLKREGKVAVEIGHVMDALAHPEVLQEVPPGVTWRRVFKEAYIARKSPRRAARILRYRKSKRLRWRRR